MDSPGGYVSAEFFDGLYAFWKQTGNQRKVILWLSYETVAFYSIQVGKSTSFTTKLRGFYSSFYSMDQRKFM